MTAPAEPQTPQVENTAETDNLTIERVPWSELGPDFARIWGKADESNPQPEHVEIIGMNGSGKTRIMCHMVQERMIVRKTPCVIICTKEQDDTILKLGWPIVDTPEKVRKERWCIYWPRTNKTGRARRLYQAGKIRDLLDYLWRPNSNTIVVFDDLGYTQGLITEDKEPLNPLIEMYLREGRSEGITNVLIKQRPQGARREMHSETYWTIAFVPKDHADAERFAELFGKKQEWLPVFEQMDPDKHEFLIMHVRSRSVYVSWTDEPLRAVKRPERKLYRALIARVRP
jgi:hypothetical protein